MKCASLTCDLEEQLDTATLNDCLHAVFDGNHCPSIREIDTGEDIFGVIISSENLTAEAAQRAFKICESDDNLEKLAVDFEP